jgi:hypothetical protein
MPGEEIPPVAIPVINPKTFNYYCQNFFTTYISQLTPAQIQQLFNLLFANLPTPCNFAVNYHNAPHDYIFSVYYQNLTDFVLILNFKAILNIALDDSHQNGMAWIDFYLKTPDGLQADIVHTCKISNDTNALDQGQNFSRSDAMAVTLIVPPHYSFKMENQTTPNVGTADVQLVYEYLLSWYEQPSP